MKESLSNEDDDESTHYSIEDISKLEKQNLNHMVFTLV